MKHLFFTLLAFMALNVNAQDLVSVEPITLSKSGTANVWVDISLPSYPSELRAINIDIQFPDGFVVGTSIQDWGDGCKWDYDFDEQGTATNWAATVTKKTDNGTYYHIVAYASDSSKPFHGTSGRLCCVKVKAPATAGIYEVKILKSTYAAKSGKDDENLNWTEEQVSTIIVGEPSEGTNIPLGGSVSENFVESIPSGSTVDISNVTSISGTTGDTKVDVNYTRNDVKLWSTVCFPYDVPTANDQVTYYTIDEIKSNALVVSPVTGETLTAGTPALAKLKDANATSFSANATSVAINANSETVKGKLTGCFQRTKVDNANAYYIKNNSFWLCNNYFYVPAFKAYFQGDDSVAKTSELDITEGEATAINTINAESGDVQSVYGVNGALQNGVQNGLNIVKMADGRVMKVIVK